MHIPKHFLLPKLLLITLMITLIGCGDSDDSGGSVSVEGRSIYIENFTGHLVRRSGERCGSGVKVAIVLSSEKDKQEYIYEPDTYKNAIIDIDKGDVMTVQVYEIDGSERKFLVQGSAVYDPPTLVNDVAEPAIRLCPKDQLEFWQFN